MLLPSPLLPPQRLRGALLITVICCFSHFGFGQPQPLGTDQVIRIVEQRTGGKVINVQPNKAGLFYKVRVLQPNGRVKNLVIDGRDGQLKRHKAKRGK